MRIAIGADHRGYSLKEKVIRALREEGIPVTDFGTESEESCDYPDSAFAVAESVQKGEHERGVLICASGIGHSIAANKVAGIRAALCLDMKIARLSRQHNDANVLVLAADFTDHDQAVMMVKEWLSTSFDGGRHQRRIEKISQFEAESRCRG
ncbi:hypothetical protein AMJ39_04660 [candidate division TA06 bacterium DG_24]|jgi:ribose 5-phosphate isomerase B|uniref:Ribose 5-phosphate isomerase n=3 Tax=Bacteria division TA06 TaxID=1156500 RepID=A0A0S8JPF2_UNCT6|nr:MAG: hypothetical protein AMJ39_04660 [candidate division TA06 bacterium DG_24]KPK71519.1 MAG: hypothetical protein AMJ82_00735 [candidate division TA06 bacterium SM23_40]KPL11636.1 MAG: hypothetical protein AMJ71_00215 [candidate division TA06 bacterium SM1_40]